MHTILKSKPNGAVITMKVRIRAGATTTELPTRGPKTSGGCCRTLPQSFIGGNVVDVRLDDVCGKEWRPFNNEIEEMGRTMTKKRNRLFNQGTGKGGGDGGGDDR